MDYCGNGNTTNVVLLWLFRRIKHSNPCPAFVMLIGGVGARNQLITIENHRAMFHQWNIIILFPGITKN